MPIYQCTTKIAPSQSQAVEVVQLVEAANLAAAVRHVAAGIITAEVAKPADLVQLGAQGVKIERAGT